MSVIKSTDGDLDTRVRALGAEAPAPPRIDPEILALRGEVERLTRDLASRDNQVAELRSEVEAARRDGIERGREAGLEAGAARAEATLDRLQRGVDVAVGQLARDLISMERLAVALAREGLSKVLGEDADRASLVTQIIRTQVAQLEAQAVLCIEVSPQDFPDAASLSDLAVGPGIRTEAVSSLASGDCRIQLKLGALEVGLDRQWTNLSAILDDLALPEVSA